MAQETLIEGIFRSLNRSRGQVFTLLLVALAATAYLNHAFPTVYESQALLRVLTTERDSHVSLAASMNGILSQRAILNDALTACGIDLSGKPGAELFSFEDNGPGLVLMRVRNSDPDLLPVMGDSFIRTLSQKFLSYSSDSQSFEIEALEKKRLALQEKIRDTRRDLESSQAIDCLGITIGGHVSPEEVRALETKISEDEVKLRKIPAVKVVAAKETSKSFTETLLQLSEARANLLELLKTYREKHPKVVGANDLIDRLEQRLKSTPRRKDTQISNPEYETLKSEIERNQARLTEMKILALQPRPEASEATPAQDPETLKTRLSTLEGLYADCLKNLEDVKLRQSSADGRIQVLKKDREPPQAIGLTWVQRQGLGLLCGALLSVLLLYSPAPTKTEIVSMSAPILMNPGPALPALDYHPILQVPALAHSRLALPEPDAESVCVTQYDERLIALNEPDSKKLEPYRTLRSNLQIAFSETGARILIVASSRTGMGRTTLIANLGVLFAQAGYSVVLVDANFRRPVLHRLFDLENHQGLSNVLCGRGSINLVQATSVKNLGVLTSGPVPQNPSELLGSVSMIELLESLKRRVEIVMIDTPALLDYPDAGILASNAGGIVFLNRTDEPEKDIASSRDFLRNIRARILGYVTT